MTKKDWGVDLEKMAYENVQVSFIRPTVQNRVVHIDADFLAYQVSWDDTKSLDFMKSNCEKAIQRIKEMAGADKALLHLTASKSTKGNRYNIAMLKEYQATRKNRVRPKFLNVIKEWMHKEHGAILSIDAEADDTMAQEQYAAIAAGTPELSVIASKDKDLRMVPGWQLDVVTGDLSYVPDFGWIDLKQVGKVKKIVGRGWKFFWAQMLTGDNADNISGLPKVYDPKYLKTGRPLLCGPALAYSILDPIESNIEAFKVVSGLYKLYGKEVGFTNYRDNSKITWGEAFKSEAKLFWMRRDKTNEDDVMDWMEETCFEPED